LLFLRDPKQVEIYPPIAVKKFIFLLIGTLVLIIPSALLIEWVGLDQFNSVIEDMMKDKKWLVVILAIFLAPIIEEPIFRLHLDLKKSSIW